MSARGRLAALLLALMLTLSFAACGAGSVATPSLSPDATTPAVTASAAPVVTVPAATSTATPAAAGRAIVLYFSATGNTKAVAELIAECAGAELFEIEPAEEYSADDLDYNNDGSRSSVEQRDASARPELVELPELEGYDVVYLGFPIWWGKAPRPVCTFVEYSELAGKMVAPFCTSGGSAIGSAAEELKALAPDAKWLAGQRFAAGATKAEIEAWLGGLSTAQE